MVSVDERGAEGVTDIERGDLVLVTFPDPDEAPEGTFENPHPAVVLQNNSDNAKLDSTIVIPVTSGDDAHPLCEVQLTPSRDDVENESIAVLNQITTVSIPDQIKDVDGDESAWKMGSISSKSMKDIEMKLEYVLGY